MMSATVWRISLVSLSSLIVALSVSKWTLPGILISLFSTVAFPTALMGFGGGGGSAGGGGGAGGGGSGGGVAAFGSVLPTFACALPEAWHPSEPATTEIPNTATSGKMTFLDMTRCLP